MSDYANTVTEARKRGDKYYYTGKPCKHGHYAVRKVSNKRCSECGRKSYRKWREANRERERERARQWRIDNLERKRENERRWREANRERARNYARRWAEANYERKRENLRRWRGANREHSREYARRWYETNSERAREKNRQWCKNNLDKNRYYEHTRRARKHGNGEAMTSAEYREWEAAQEKKCFYCDADLSNGSYTVDHIVPLSKGGVHQANNLCIACKPCNFSKGDKDPEEFLNEFLGAG